MERRVLRALTCIALALAGVLLGSCNAPHLSVLQGNYAFGRGQYQTATVHYLTADVRAEHEAWIDYNLGNVYYALGELDAALEQWDLAASEAPDEILFGVYFNRGVLYYELAQYQAAYEEFRRALRIDGTSIDAKINLELSLQKIGAPDPRAPIRGAVSADRPPEVSAQAARVLQYIRRKERQRWFADDTTVRESQSNDW